MESKRLSLEKTILAKLPEGESLEPEDVSSIDDS